MFFLNKYSISQFFKTLLYAIFGFILGLSCWFYILWFLVRCIGAEHQTLILQHLSPLGKILLLLLSSLLAYFFTFSFTLVFIEEGLKAKVERKGGYILKMINFVMYLILALIFGGTLLYKTLDCLGIEFSHIDFYFFPIVLYLLLFLFLIILGCPLYFFGKEGYKGISKIDILCYITLFFSVLIFYPRLGSF